MVLADLADFKVYPPIHVAADVAVVETERAILAEAHHLDGLVGDSKTDEKFFYLLSPHKS